jgi:predicted nucleic acid-binding protein
MKGINIQSESTYISGSDIIISTQIINEMCVKMRRKENAIIVD